MNFNKLYWDLYNRKFDFYYLSSVLKEKEKKTIYAGSSYSIFGITPAKDEICVGLPSQDFYYSDKLIRQIIQEYSPEKIVFIIGYYTPFCDLSRTKNEAEQNRIDDVYFPILKDVHNRNYDGNQTLRKDSKSIKNIIKTIIINRILMFQHFRYFMKPVKIYFDKIHSRENRKRVTWENPKLSWFQLNLENRIEAGQKRASGHEKFLSYESSFVENIDIVNSLYSFCKKNKIRFEIVFAPFSNEYLSNMSMKYVEKAITVKKILEEKCDYIVDMNNLDLDNGNITFDNNGFSELDFVDADHLSDVGANKFRAMLEKLVAY